MTDEERAREALPYTEDGVLAGVALVERFIRETDTELTFPAATILTRLFAEAIGHEREECAKVADIVGSNLAFTREAVGALDAAEAIRARGGKT